MKKEINNLKTYAAKSDRTKNDKKIKFLKMLSYLIMNKKSY